MTQSCSTWRRAIVLAMLLVAPAAVASPVTEFHPSFSVAGGADDNLLFNGQGGDGVGRLTARARYRVRDHLWSASVDGAASLYTFVQRDQRVPLGELTARYGQLFTRYDKLEARIRVRGSDDPLALAQIGLFGGGGTAVGFRSSVDYQHAFSERWSVGSGLVFNGIRYFDVGFTQRSGETGGLLLTPRYRLTRDLTLEATAEGRLFFGDGIIGQSVGLLPGARYRIARRLFVEAAAGVSVFNDNQGSVPVPVVRSVLTWDGRWTGFRLTASQDLTVPNGRAGVLKTQIIESAFHYGIRDWDVGLRAGYYRSLASPRADLWIPGFGVDGAVSYRMTSFMWMGVSALHFERIANVTQPSMSRNAIYLRFDFTSGRP